MLAIREAEASRMKNGRERVGEQEMRVFREKRGLFERDLLFFSRVTDAARVSSDMRRSSFVSQEAGLSPMMK